MRQKLKIQLYIYSSRAVPPEENLGKAIRTCHSQPLSLMEYAQNTSNVISLAEHLGTRISDHVPETPNKLSEDMIKCIAAIYIASLQNHRSKTDFDVQLDNPFHVEGLKEFSGPYSTMVEVPWIFRDSQKLSDVEHLLQNFRSLICQLEEIDPRKLKHEEKLAFWINIHNALVMHAFLAYGVPQNNVKRLFLLLRAVYNIGGHTIGADTIQNTILGCRISRPGQWIRLLLSSRTKFKTADERQAYAIEHPEPL
ncbi:putative set domain protein [Hibiscus syriacus]|uniref:Set domain protein n=1 Tax=Hibiscus syriacus TaxID=106335 RepID=A0A6A3BIF2_HIBSY|nr:putative set domain protein [Hibiscus syriacus]